MKKSNFLEGAFIATLAIFFTKFLGIIYVIPFYNIVGNTGGALYGYAYNIYNIFLVISTAGIPLAISKLVSEYNALKKYSEKEYLYQIAKKIIMIFSITCFLICFIFAPVIAKIIIGDVTGGNTVKDIEFVIRCVSFAILIVPNLAISKGYLQGHGFIKVASISQVIEQIVRIIVILVGSFSVIYIFNLSLTTAVGVAVFGAFASALVAYIYLINKMSLIKKETTEKQVLAKETKKNITQKLITYSIPFIVINIANSLYNSTDMILLIRGLDILGYSGIEVETISSIFTTWGHKINSIITSIATGVAISLIPTISENRANKDYEGINDKFNKLLQIFFYIALPLAIFISIFSTEVWTIFYGNNNDISSFYGPLVLKLFVITAAVDALYIMICNGLQGLNKTKLIYGAVISGLLINLALDIPLMFVFNYLGMHAFYGAIVATIIGYSISLIIPIISLKKEFKMNFSNTLKNLPKLFIIYIIMIVLSLTYRGIISIVDSRMYLCLLLLIFAILLLLIYIMLNKTTIEEITGKKFDKLIRKRRD